MHLYTLILVLISWVIFRADNLPMAVTYIGNMFGVNSAGLIDTMAIDYIRFSGFIIIIGAILSTTIVKNIWTSMKINENVKSLLKVIITLVIFAFSILACISSTYNPFIYFNF